MQKPERPFFNSGPCVKPLGWRLTWLEEAALGRSHRLESSLMQFKRITDGLRTLLNIPETHLIGFTPGSATGAMEMAMWNLLGSRSVSCVTWDIFSQHWAYNARVHLKLDSPCYGWKDLKLIPKNTDLLLTWTGTTRGIWVGDNHDWLEDWQGLVICDATSAVFVADLPWDKLDAVAFSWQKALAGEAASGVLVLSPKAYKHLAQWTPPWPIPRLLRLKNAQGKPLDGFFEGETLNTPSMLLAQEQEALIQFWIDQGGLCFGLERAKVNFDIIAHWVESYSWLDFLEKEPQARAKGPVCLTVEDQKTWPFFQEMAHVLKEEQAAYEILNHAHDVACLRIWAGPSIESVDLERLGPWLNWAFEKVWKIHG